MGRLPALECVLLRPGHEDMLAGFFADLAAAGDDAHFRPHPFDAASLRGLAQSTGQDIHALFVEGDHVRAYGLLRGWNEGYAVPSLGVAVHPAARSLGMGRLVMEYLETVARRRGASVVRLRVHRDNAAAIAMYERRGYALRDDDGDPRLLVGSKPLGGSG